METDVLQICVFVGKHEHPLRFFLRQFSIYRIGQKVTFGKAKYRGIHDAAEPKSTPL
jgi:hypothetical protein